MNRTFSRIFGFVVAIVGVGTCIDVANAETGKKPEARDRCTPRTLPSACNLSGATTLDGVRYVSCPTTYRSEGFVSTNLVSKYSDCADVPAGNYVHFSGAGCASGYCDSQLIFCATPDFFINESCGWGTEAGSNYCSYGMGYVDVANGDPALYFLNCSSGFYLTRCPGGPYGSVSGFQGLCEPCSGLRFDGDQLKTFDNYSGHASSGAIYWRAEQTVTTITTCRAYLSGSLSGNQGSFEISDSGCDYLM